MTHRVLSIFGTKGGVGKTLIAANLSAALADTLRAKTALLELGALPGDAARLLGGSSVHRVTEPVAVESFPTLLADLRSAFDYVVIDAGSSFTQLLALAFERSNLILLVTTPDVVSLQHTQRAIETLARLRIPLRMVKAIINRAESRGNFRSAEVKGYLSVGVIAELPSDGRLTSLSVNKGVPLTKLQETGRITDMFRQLARTLSGSPELYVEPVTIDTAQLPAAAQLPPSLAGQRDGSARSRAETDDPGLLLKRRIHSKLIERFDLKRIDLTSMDNPETAQQIRQLAEQLTLELLAEEGGFVIGQDRRAALVKEIIDEAMGLGPLEDLMADDLVSDILVNGKDRVYIEKRGKLTLTEKRFVSDEQVLTIIERIIAPLGRRIDESTPMVDARLPDGSRINAIIPPLSLRGPILSIRRFSRERYRPEDLVAFGTLSAPMTELLRACVEARKNIIVSGGTGSGKTTALNVLSSFIPRGERIITIEDAAELRLDHEHWIPLESRPQNIEGKGAITARQLFRNALRMRPDRIIIGECRGDETLDMLQAMNTGHDGSLATLHANSPSDVVSRLDSLVLMSHVDLPARAIREQVASAIDLIVHTARLSDGSRKITHVSEITGMDDDANISFGHIFVFQQEGLGRNGEVLGVFKPTGYLPSFMEELRRKGIRLDERVFAA